MFLVVCNLKAQIDSVIDSSADVIITHVATNNNSTSIVDPTGCGDTPKQFG